MKDSIHTARSVWSARSLLPLWNRLTQCDSASKLDALQTLRVGMYPQAPPRLASVMEYSRAEVGGSAIVSRASSPRMACWIVAFCIVMSAWAGTAVPVRIIFDTDIGNDVDDVLALSVLHAFQSRDECELLAVTITKPDELAGPFVDAVNTFYGRPGIPIGFTHAGLKNEPSKFLPLAETKDDRKPRYPHRLKRSSDAPAATALLRKVLSRQPDRSVVLVQVGYFSNFAALLDTPGDASSPLAGRELVQQKVRLLSVMAGSFKTNRHDLEYNVVKDLPASKRLAQNWPTPIVWSGYEIGIAVQYPAVSIQRDFAYVPHHPAAEAYCLYRSEEHTSELQSPCNLVCRLLL